MKQSATLWFVLIVTGLIIPKFLPIVNRHFVTSLVFCFLASRFWKFIIFKRVPRRFRLQNRETAIVTGASSGIGSKIASLLWQKGAKVIWTARDVKKAYNVSSDIEITPEYGPRNYIMFLDLADKKSIEDFVRDFKSRENKLNLLVLNAAYHGPKKMTKNGFEQSIGVNHLGHMYLVYLLLDLLAENQARIVVLVSDLHKMCKKVQIDDLMWEKSEKNNYTPWSAYNHSKLLNILFVKHLTKRLAVRGVKVHAAHPGTPIITELMRDGFLGSFLVDQCLLRPLGFLFCRSTHEGAQTPLFCCLAPECGEKSGCYYENCREVQPSRLALDEKMAEKLWNQSCDLLKIDRNWC